MFVPRWFIKQRTHRGGIRQPKLIPYKKSWEQPAPVQKSASRALSDLVNGVECGEAGWMHWEYRFWCANLSKDNLPEYGICRACGSSVKMFEGRRKHGMTNSCNVKLTKAFSKLLNAEKKCMICNNSTTKQKFGVLLCGDECMKEWLYGQFQPVALTCALNLVEREEIV